MTIIASTLQAVEVSPDVADVIERAVRAGEIVRRTETYDEIGQADSGAHLIHFAMGCVSCWAMSFWDVANTETSTYPDRVAAEAAYEEHVRDLAATGWRWDSSDVDGILDREGWLLALDDETDRCASAFEAMSFACAAGTFGGVDLAPDDERWDDERLVIVAENGWVARHDPSRGWI